MDMSEVQKSGRKVLCGANSYLEKYYLNEEFSRLPEAVQQELKIMCVLFTEEVGGILVLEFAEDGTLLLRTAKEDGDFLYDDIEGEVMIRRLQKEKRELLQSLELYYRTAFLKQNRLHLEGEDL